MGPREGWHWQQRRLWKLGMDTRWVLHGSRVRVGFCATPSRGKGSGTSHMKPFRVRTQQPLPCPSSHSDGSPTFTVGGGFDFLGPCRWPWPFGLSPGLRSCGLEASLGTPTSYSPPRQQVVWGGGQHSNNQVCIWKRPGRGFEVRHARSMSRLC